MRTTYEVWLWATPRGIILFTVLPDQRGELVDRVQAICDATGVGATLTLGTTIEASPKDARGVADRWFDSLGGDDRVALFSSMVDGIKMRLEQGGQAP